ncbi:hypothetical protein C8Q78DRAFT_989406 [Trametes maxima]|nr:hypothetical protein C8Q78DRAFT_989406 [Trametes maxima]
MDRNRNVEVLEEWYEVNDREVVGYDHWPDTLSIRSSYLAYDEKAEKTTTRVLSAVKNLRRNATRPLPTFSLGWRRAGFGFKRKRLRRCLPTHLLVAVISLATTYDPPSGGGGFGSRMVGFCTACQSEIIVPAEEVVRVPCGHLYHAECLLTLVDVSMKSMSQFPPRCCRRIINTSLFRGYLTSAQWEAFALREAERATPRRVYCANPHCSRFLGPREMQTPVRVYICPVATCTARTCARCKATVAAPADSSEPHKHRCTQDAMQRAALELGGRMGWARCPACEELIERYSGCAHMTCVCGTHFCYDCSQRWDSCTCNERPPRGAIGRAAGRRDLFAPLQQGNDLDRRLELWVPPTLQEEGSEPSLEPLPELDPLHEEELEPEGYVRVDEPAAPARPNLWLAVERMQTVQAEETVPPRKPLGLSEKLPVQVVVVSESEDQDESGQDPISVKLPYGLVERGLLAQEARRRNRPARRLTV